MNNCNCCCEIVKLIHSAWQNGNSAIAFGYLIRYMKIALCKIVPPLTLTFVQTLTQIQGAGFVGGESSVGQFHGGQYSDHGGNFTEGNFPVKIQRVLSKQKLMQLVLWNSRLL